MKAERFFHKSGTKQECMLSPLLFKNVPEVLARIITQEIEIKGNWTGKREIKLSFTDDLITYIKTENPKESTEELLEVIINSAELQGKISTHKNQLFFLYAKGTIQQGI